MIKLKIWLPQSYLCVQLIGWLWQKPLQSNRFLRNGMLKILSFRILTIHRKTLITCNDIWQNFKLPYPCGEWQVRGLVTLILTSWAAISSRHREYVSYPRCVRRLATSSPGVKPILDYSLLNIPTSVSSLPRHFLTQVYADSRLCLHPRETNNLH